MASGRSGSGRDGVLGRAKKEGRGGKGEVGGCWYFFLGEVDAPVHETTLSSYSDHPAAACRAHPMTRRQM